MTRLYDLARTRQLKHNRIGWCFVAGPGGPHAELQIGVSQDLFCFKPVLADDVRDFHFRATQRKIDRCRHSEEKNDCNRNDDCDAAEDGQNSGKNTHQVAKSNTRPDQGQDADDAEDYWTGFTRFSRMNKTFLLILKIL